MRAFGNILGCLYLMLSVHPLQAKESMNWAVVHWPPFMILKGQDKGEGSYNAHLTFIQQNMPKYTHANIGMNWKRTWRLIAKGDERCNVLSLKTAPRELIAEFSIANSVTLSNRIIMREETFKNLGEPTSISLAALLKDSKLQGKIEVSRSYTATLDKIIAQNATTQDIERVAVDAEHLMKMLMVNRFDYFIEYPIAAHYLRRQHLNLPNAIKSVEITEIAPYTVGYLACPKTAWGKQRIADYNNVLQALRPTPKYREIMEMWYASEAEKRAVREGFNEVLRLQ